MDKSMITAAANGIKTVRPAEILVYYNDKEYEGEHEFPDVLDFLYDQIDMYHDELDRIREAALSTSGRYLSSKRSLRALSANQIMKKLDYLEELIRAVKESDAECYCFAKREAALYEIVPSEDSSQYSESGYGLEPVPSGETVKLVLKKIDERLVTAQKFYYKNVLNDKDCGDFQSLKYGNWKMDARICDILTISSIPRTGILMEFLEEKDWNRNRWMMVLSKDEIPRAQEIIDKLLERDQIRRCKDCGKLFVLPYFEAEWFKEKNMLLPKRCKACREKRR